MTARLSENSYSERKLMVKLAVKLAHKSQNQSPRKIQRKRDKNGMGFFNRT